MKFIKKLIKLYKWNRLLWNDYDFDYVYLLKIIRFKMELMEPIIREGYSIDADKTADSILKSINLLKILEEEDFHKHMDKLDAVYGSYTFTKLPNGNSKLDRALITEENKEAYAEDMKQAMLADKKDRDKTKREFINSLKVYDTWWD